MRMLSWLRLWLRALLHRDRVEAELRRELQFHLDRETDFNISRGMSPDDARDGSSKRSVMRASPLDRFGAAPRSR